MKRMDREERVYNTFPIGKYLGDLSIKLWIWTRLAETSELRSWESALVTSRQKSISQIIFSSQKLYFNKAKSYTNPKEWIDLVTYW